MVITRAVMFRPGDVFNDGHSQTAMYSKSTFSTSMSKTTRSPNSMHYSTPDSLCGLPISGRWLWLSTAQEEHIVSLGRPQLQEAPQLLPRNVNFKTLPYASRTNQETLYTKETKTQMEHSVNLAAKAVEK